MEKRKLLFGPLVSRRLGRSLGIDLIPYKTCSLDCIYCECGKTNFLKKERVEYFKVSDVILEIDQFFKKNSNIDFITFAGSGEPTLYKGLKEIITHIKNKYPKVKQALITNSTLLGQEEVRDEITAIDVIIPSLDAISEDLFIKINRPYKDIKSIDVIDGLLEFKKSFIGEMWLELFIIPGVNDTDEELYKFKDYLETLNPNKIQLNSLDRPGTERWVKSATISEIERVKRILNLSNIEIISKNCKKVDTPVFNPKKYEEKHKEKHKELVLQTIKIRPCTMDDLLLSTGLKSFEINKLLREFEEQNVISFKEESRGIFYLYNKNFT